MIVLLSFYDYVADLIRAINSTTGRVSNPAKLHRGANPLVNLFFHRNRYVLHGEWCNGARIELWVPVWSNWIDCGDGRRSQSFPEYSNAPREISIAEWFIPRWKSHGMHRLSAFPHFIACNADYTEFIRQSQNNDLLWPSSVNHASLSI